MARHVAIYGGSLARALVLAEPGVTLSSALLVGPRMAVSFGIELHDSFMDGAVEVIRAGESLVSEVMPLGLSQSFGVYGSLSLRAVSAPPNWRWRMILSATAEKLK